jgi:hypothetical protein
VRSPSAWLDRVPVTSWPVLWLLCVLWVPYTVE